MQQQGDDKSVSHCAVLADALASNDDDGGPIWAKMPRAAVEKQLAARPESCSVSDSASAASVTCSPRVTSGKRKEALGDVDIGVVDVESFHFSCSSKVVVPGGMVGDSMTVGAVLDSGSGITCLSERLAQQVEQHVRSERLVLQPCVKDMSFKLTNEHEIVVRNQTSTL